MRRGTLPSPCTQLYAFQITPAPPQRCVGTSKMSHNKTLMKLTINSRQAKHNKKIKSDNHKLSQKMIIFNIFARNYFLSNVVNCAQFFFELTFFFHFISMYNPPSQNFNISQIHCIILLTSIQAFMTIIQCQVTLIWILLVRSCQHSWNIIITTIYTYNNYYDGVHAQISYLLIEIIVLKIQVPLKLV